MTAGSDPEVVAKRQAMLAEFVHKLNRIVRALQGTKLYPHLKKVMLAFLQASFLSHDEFARVRAQTMAMVASS